MKNKAKWTALLMCGILLFSGCKATDDNDSGDTTDVITQTTDAPDKDTIEPTEVPSDAAVTPAPTKDPSNASVDATQTPAPTESPEQSLVPRIAILPEEIILYAEDGTTLLTITDFTLSIDGDNFSALQSAFDRSHPGIADEDYRLLYEEASEHYAFSPDYFYGYSSNISAVLSRCDNSVVSFRTLYSDYVGGAHGMYAYCGESYNVETGQLLTLADLIADAEGFYPNAIEYINNALYEEYGDGLFAEYQSTVGSSLSPDNEPLWYMTATGIVICFTPYEVGPYAMGAPEITLPYSEFAAYLHAKYAPATGEAIAKIGLNQDISSLIGADKPLIIEAVDNDWRVDISLSSGSDKVSLGTFNYFMDGYVIKRADGRSFVLIACDYMSADSITFLYEVTDGKLVACNEMPNMFPTGENITPEDIEMSVAITALGSYGGRTNYKLTPEGYLVHDDELYQITAPYPLKIIKPLPVTIDDSKTTLDAGTQISITGTNLVDEIHFKVVGSEITGTIYYTHEGPEGFIFYIDGVSEYEYFEDLPYAG